MKVFAFDVETTGTEPLKHEIVQLAGKIFINGNEKEDINLLFRPENIYAIDQKALEIIGKTEDELKQYPHKSNGFKKLIEVLDRYVDKYNPDDKFYFCGYNVSFDILFLRDLFETFNIGLKKKKYYFGSYFWWYNTDPRIDPFSFLQMYKIKYDIPIKNLKLSSVCKHFGVRLDNAHDALADIEATLELSRKVFKAMLPLN